jgi:diguanylate cyclase (GGDEF)-like protein/PAS domain S-box-containing protein
VGKPEHGAPSPGWGVRGGVTETLLAALLARSSDIVTVLDAEGMILYASPATERILGYPPGSNVGVRLLDIVHPEDRARVLETLQRGLDEGLGAVATLELRVARAAGGWCWLEAVASNLLDDPVVGGIVVNSRDVTERRRAIEELTHAAYHDALTGLPNRALLLDRLGQALARADRSGLDVAVLFIDLDKFKAVNDRSGHAAGDEVLIEVARRLTACIRPADTAARIGGDEYVIVAEGLSLPVEAVSLGERVAEELGRPVTINSGTAVVQASVGIGYGRDVEPAVLLDRADQALYEAKRRGGGVFAERSSAARTESGVNRDPEHG